MATEKLQFSVYKQPAIGSHKDKREWEFSVTPATNVLHGYQRSSIEEFMKIATPAQKKSAFLDMTKAFGSKATSLEEAFAGTSGYVMQNGVLTTQKAIDQQKALASDPNMINVGTAQAPKYIPKGSAAEANIPNIGKTAQGITVAERDAQKAQPIQQPTGYTQGMSLTNPETGQVVKVWNEQNYKNYLAQGFNEDDTRPLKGQEPPKAEVVKIPKGQTGEYLGTVNGKLQTFPNEQAAQQAGATGIEPNYKRYPIGQPQATEPTLIEITSQRPDVLDEAKKHGGDPYTAGTGANTWLNDWYNRVGKAEGADMARRGLFDQPALEGEVINTGSESIPTIEIPDELANNEFFQQLDDDNKSMISYYWSIMESQDVEKEKKFEEAMELAGEQAGPYWREKINIMTDEVKRYFGTLDTDLANREKELMVRKQRLEDDLLYHSKQFSIEEQAEMSRIKDEYDVQIENTRESMASKGLSSSSIRNRAEERLTKSKEDMVGSSQRKYERELRSLTTGTQRTKEDLERSVAELRERTKTSKVSTARKAEEYLGSERAGEEDILKPHLAGGISGQLVEDKSSGILKRAQDLMSLSY